MFSTHICFKGLSTQINVGMILEEPSSCYHDIDASLLLDQNGPRDGPAAEGRVYRCRKHGFWNHKGHDVR